MKKKQYMTRIKTCVTNTKVITKKNIRLKKYYQI